MKTNAEDCMKSYAKSTLNSLHVEDFAKDWICRKAVRPSLAFGSVPKLCKTTLDAWLPSSTPGNDFTTSNGRVHWPSFLCHLLIC